MNDLHLWRLLRQEAPAAADLVPPLRELAGLSLRERLPFLGVLPRALGHADAEVRAAAALCLREAAGSLAFRQLVRLLHAPELPVRLAAAEALRQAAANDPPRWAHALFHPDAEVRRFAALAKDSPVPAWYALYLLPDPVCSAELLPRLEGHAAPEHLLPLVFDNMRRGLLPRAAARSLLAAMSWQGLYRGLGRCHFRAKEQIERILAAAAEPDGGVRLGSPDLPADALDDVLDLFWAPEDGGANAADDVEDFFNRMRSGKGAMHEDEVARVATALLVTAARRGGWNEWAAATCAVYHPDVLTYPWIPRDQRRRALHGFYALGTRCGKLADDAVRRLLGNELFRRPSGNLDLWAVGAILHLVKKNPYVRLVTWFGVEAVVASFLEDMEGSAAFLCHTDDSPKGRTFLINEIGRRSARRRAFLLALLIQAVPADGLDFLDALDGPAAVEVFAELAALAGKPGLTLSEAKVRHLAGILAAKLAPGHVAEFLAAWLRLPEPETFTLGLRVLGELARALDGEAVLPLVERLAVPELRKFLTTVAWCAGFPYGKELQLAHALAWHPDKDVREWAGTRTTAKEVVPPQDRRSDLAMVRISEQGIRIIGRCDDDELHRELVVRELLRTPTVGLAAALSRRPTPSAPHLQLCAALLACHDPVEPVAEQFARFGSDDAAFLRQLDERAVRLWLPEEKLPLFGHAWLYRWEQHNAAFHEQLAALWPGGLPEALTFARSLTAKVLGRSMWEAAALMLGIWRWRNRAGFQAACTEELGAVLIDTLDGDLGDVAARVLVLLHEGNAAPDLLREWKKDVAARLPDLSDEVRRVLQFWVDASGLGAATGPRRRIASPKRAEILPRIHGCSDLDQLEEWCALEDDAVVEEAALRLLEMGEVGAARLARLLGRTPPPPLAAVLAVTVSLWPEGPALAGLRAFVADARRPAQLRFLSGLGLLKRGERRFQDAVLDAACAESPQSWFRPEHWRELVEAGVTERELSLRLATSPHPHAHAPAVRRLAAKARFGERTRRVLLAFLEAGTARMRELRLQAAAWLHRHGEEAAFPLLLENEYGASAPQTPTLLRGAAPELVEAAVTAALAAGPAAVSERLLFDLLTADGVDEDARAAALTRLLSDAVNDAVKTSVLSALGPSRSRSRKLRQVAESFAWGVRQGRELTGKLFAIEMIAGEQLGYTRLNQNKVYINPLPLLRGEANARETVQGLIVHEFGHHMYHKGAGAEAVWQRAEKEGLFRLLNLVSDEHLERNLRARSEELGDHLKKLAAYAFQHAEREMAVETLLEGLQGRAFEVLTATRLNAARRPGRVVVQSGHILLEMEKAGMSFARFFRALRMGLGNRHHDPKVAEALALFRGKFRQSSMEDLYALSKKLREIFGAEIQILQAMTQDGCAGGDGSELLAEGEGISNGEVQDEVERILNPRKSPGAVKDGKVGGKLWINVNEDERFETIRTVTPVEFDPAEHARYARQVARPARAMRRYLSELGLTMRPQRLRVQGKNFDRTRVQALLTRGDPRVLIARQQQVVTDLFLGIVIDCSGSMQTGENIEKAKLFGVLLAEAARGLDGIDVRLFGFTDQTIYDAGDAGRCAVHGLLAGGGNNDAAGLWHAAQAALTSRRKAKLLVMISDGLPTECSVAALRGLVRQLSVRLKMCCAQVAVRPLEEVCFPNYVLLEESDPGKSVRRFGAIVARLVRKALRGA